MAKTHDAMTVEQVLDGAVAYLQADWTACDHVAVSRCLACLRRTELITGLQTTLRDALAKVTQERDEALKQLGQCYRETGADPDGNEDWRLAPFAVNEVRRLRRDYTKAVEQSIAWERRFKDEEDALSVAQGELATLTTWVEGALRSAKGNDPWTIGYHEALSHVSDLLPAAPAHAGQTRETE